MCFDCTRKKEKRFTRFWPWIWTSQKNTKADNSREVSWKIEESLAVNSPVSSLFETNFNIKLTSLSARLTLWAVCYHSASCMESTSLCASAATRAYNLCLPFITSPDFSSGLPDPHKQVQHYHRNMPTASWTICVEALCLWTTLLSQRLLSNVAICSHSKPRGLLSNIWTQLLIGAIVWLRGYKMTCISCIATTLQGPLHQGLLTTERLTLV